MLPKFLDNQISIAARHLKCFAGFTALSHENNDLNKTIRKHLLISSYKENYYN